MGTATRTVFERASQSFIYELVDKRKIKRHLAEIDKQAEEMFSQLVNEMTKAHGITEQLKASEPMLWVAKMNAIRSAAMEVVNSEVIYV